MHSCSVDGTLVALHGSQAALPRGEPLQACQRLAHCRRERRIELSGSMVGRRSLAYIAESLMSLHRKRVSSAQCWS